MYFSQQNKKLIIFSITSVLGFTLIMGNACGQFESESLASKTSDLGTSCPMGNCAAEAVPGEKTVSVIPANRVLASMESCLGVSASTATLTSFLGNGTNGKRESLSTEGLSHTVNSSAMMALAQVGAEICQDLVAAERAKAAAERTYFAEIDFSKGPSMQTEKAIVSATQSIARNCWAREAEANELAMIIDTYADIYSEQTTAALTQNAMMSLCTSLIASSQFYQQ